MNNAEKKKWLRIIRPIALCLALVFLLSCATYAWMKRDWHATIKQSNVQIVAGASLTFYFGDENLEEATVNDLLGMNEFVFKSVSNFSGYSEDFFALNYLGGLNNDTLKKLRLEDLTQAEKNSSLDPYTVLGKKYGYIDFTFTVGSDDQNTKDIYFDSSSKIDPSTSAEDDRQAVKAIRMSLSVYDGDVEEAHYLFLRQDLREANEAGHKGINNEKVAGYGYLADNERLYDDSGNRVVTIPHPNQAEGIFLVKTHSDTKDFTTWATNQTTLFTLAKGEQKTLKLRIWLEGEDDNCVDSIAGSELDILLKFSARNSD